VRKKAFIGIGLLVLLRTMPAQGQGQEPPPDFNQAQNSPLNFHIGGGIGVPLNPTATFAGINGAFQVGGGPNLNRHSSLVGEFMWHGLPPTRNALLPILNSLCPPSAGSTACSCGSLQATDNLYALTANYMFHVEGQRFGYYLIGGGGWYYRHAQLKNFTVPPLTVCQPIWDWWGYSCQAGFVSNTLATRGVSSGGINGGGGFTFAVTDSGVRFYIEARYHYSPQGGRVSTQIVPVTFGFRW